MRKNTDADFWNKVDQSLGLDSCWLWLGSRLNHKTRGADRSYGMYNIRPKMILAHRYAAALSGLDITDKLVCHTCDNPPCCNPAHLYVGTHQDNSDDKVKKQRHHYKLSLEDFLTIKNSSLPSAELSIKYNVCITRIAGIKGGSIKRKGIT